LELLLEGRDAPSPRPLSPLAEKAVRATRR
jgi:hypothetical protein